ncbi:hypothetical protein [Nonomuraea wenchangensis]|uniref:hypothetical protein n=1 Tax=Nonomuraea wenchangensis TaxID=568860 RepID=UPI00331D2CFE
MPWSFAFGRPTRVVQIGESAGAELALAGSSLRTSGVEIYGAAKGLDPGTMDEVYQQIVAWTRSGEPTFDVEEVPLSEIETDRPHGQATRRDPVTRRRAAYAAA